MSHANFAKGANYPFLGYCDYDVITNSPQYEYRSRESMEGEHQERVREPTN